MSTENTKSTTKTTTTTAKTKSPSGESDTQFVIIKRESCSKLSRRTSTKLDYQIGYSPEAEQLAVRIEKNHSGGFFSREWITVDTIETLISPDSKGSGHFTATLFRQCFKSKSQNNAGFLAAALFNEKLIERLPTKQSVLVRSAVTVSQWSKQFAEPISLLQPKEKPQKGKSTPSKSKKDAQSDGGE